MNIQLPYRPDLPIHLLASCFNNTSATYKFYWFLSLIQAVEKRSDEESIIPKRELFARMISNAWHTVNYYRVSFGKQDKIQDAVRALKSIEGFGLNDPKEYVQSRLMDSQKAETKNLLSFFNNQVPHWFLSPWLPQRDRAQIYIDSQNQDNQCLYALYGDFIEVNRDWQAYIKGNARILKDFCLWNLAMFLQSKNPNVPDIPNKLIRPITRNSLTSQRKNFWDLVFKEVGSVQCIYTKKELNINAYAVEHFIPFNFVSHDLIWNLIPADPSFNSSKSDKLPPLKRYFDDFFNLQSMAVQVVASKAPNSKFLEEYLTIYPDLEHLENLPIVFTKDAFKERIQPLVTIAANNGFQYMQ